MVNNLPGKYATGADAVIALKHVGESDKIIAAMASKNKRSRGMATWRKP
jgi:hypothetical protein